MLLVSRWLHFIVAYSSTSCDLTCPLTLSDFNHSMTSNSYLLISRKIFSRISPIDRFFLPYTILIYALLSSLISTSLWPTPLQGPNIGILTVAVFHLNTSKLRPCASHRSFIQKHVSIVLSLPVLQLFYPLLCFGH